jgi:hypothetical protein
VHLFLLMKNILNLLLLAAILPNDQRYVAH